MSLPKSVLMVLPWRSIVEDFSYISTGGLPRVFSWEAPSPVFFTPCSIVGDPNVLRLGGTTLV